MLFHVCFLQICDLHCQRIMALNTLLLHDKKADYINQLQTKTNAPHQCGFNPIFSCN